MDRSGYITHRCAGDKCRGWEKNVYSAATERTIKKYDNLLTIHTHPDSFPPSIDDLNSNFDHGYVVGIVVCHDGRVFMYSANERVNENYYKLVVEGYIKNGYNENEAQIMALSEIQKNFDINFKEVTDDGSIWKWYFRDSWKI